MQSISRQQINKIIEDLQNKLKQEPENAMYLHDLGVAYMHLQEWDKALESLTESLQYVNGKEAVSSLYHRGTAYAEQGDIDKAIKEWKQVIKIDEHNVFAHYSLAKGYAFKKLYDAAIMHLKKADRYNPNRSLKLIYQTLARVYTLKGDYQEAIKALHKILDIDKEDIKVLHEISMLYLHINELSKALNYCKKELKLGSEDPSVYYNMGLAHLGLNKANKAIENFEKALVNGLTDINIRVNLGEAYAREGKMDEAIRAWEQVLAIDPKNLYASYNIGMLFYDHGLYERAIKAWDRTLKIDPSYLPAVVSTGSAYLVLGSYDLAEQYMLKAKEQAPENPAIIGNLAEILLMLKKPQEALEQAHIAARLQQTNPLVFILSGCAYAMLEQWEQAAIAWQQGYDIDENVFILTNTLITKCLTQKHLNNVMKNGGEEGSVVNLIKDAIESESKNNKTKEKTGKGVSEILNKFIKR